MAIFNIKSTIITNRDATPKVLQDPYICGGEIRECTGFVQTSTTTDGVGSTYRLCQVPSNARVSSLEFQAQALGSGCTLNVGVWYPTFIPVGAGLSAANASAVINTSLYASSLACSNANAVTNLVTSANIAINIQEQPLWQAAGLASDPGIDLDIVAYVNGTVAAQGYVGAKVRYVV